MEKALVVLNGQDLPQSCTVDVYVSNKYEASEGEKSVKAQGDVNKVSLEKHLKEGYESLVHVGNLKNENQFVALRLHLSDNENSYWELEEPAHN